MVDRNYLQNVRAGELEGAEVLVEPDEVLFAVELSERLVVNLHGRLFHKCDEI